MDRGLVILLHGVGSNGANMAALGRALAPALPSFVFESPDAPGGSGPRREWFSVIGVTEVNRPERVVAARPGFDAVIANLIEQHGFSNAVDRVVLLGFSQGSIVALDALASGRWPVGAVVAFSGRLASPAPLVPATGTPLLLIHGGADPVMPSSESVRAAELLTAAGVHARTSIEPGLGHQVSNTGLAEAARFLNEVLS
ncbi:phospholipase/carboxylesterase [Mesorhizobium loti]|jgi:phospholipase/carboxylesterase|uniref:Phospholipase/carboxylesterase n=1 Tax=Rhizobium loti TaxID=381 RepID=A0A8E3B8B7_RHILI|nr:dienelactone hydrolase family protein [Mesorhizobium loti]PWJ94763.1 phospholipase/carboxylesterase [Mesorhizobium loti]